MKSLNKKLSLLLLTLFVGVGVLLGIITRYSTVQYNLEITQRLNGSIAMYVAAEEPLIINGVYNEKALKKLAQRSMVINPTVEVYLLDNTGKILSHNLPKDSVLLDHVPLQPIRDFLRKDSQRPLLSQDPRSPDNNKAFSAAKIRNAGVDEGYIYVILGGQKYEELANDLSKNYIMKLALAAIVAVILLAFLVGTLILMKLTRPLKNLRDKVMVFQRTSTEKKDYSGDEIQQLNSAFDDMSARIENQLQQIKNADKTRRDLISNVSHDLRTPLASMQGYLDTLLIKQEKMDRKTTQDYLSIARKHCGRLGLLINDLFELSKLDSNVIKPDMEAFSMAELIQDVSMEFVHLAEQKGVKLKTQLLTGNTNVSADIGLMQRVLENLIGNALKHTPKDGEVIIKLKNSKDSGFTIVIKDTGSGISEHELPNIFNRLYRAENTSQESSTSSGLGLAIVKKILDIHHSTINVSSQLNHGTRFSFSLPVAS